MNPAGFSPLTVSAGLVALLALAVVVIYLLARLGSRLAVIEKTSDQGGAIALLQQQLDALRSEVARSIDTQAGLLDRRMADTSRTVGDRLDASGRTIGERLDSVSKTVADLREQLGQVHEASRKIFDVGRDIASLQDILRAPKIRGGLGETFLGELLAQILPEHAFTLQHPFRSGLVVDAVIRAGEHLVPIDSKFPLENFIRMTSTAEGPDRSALRRAFLADVRRHIDSIAEKYIRPAEGTFDFALMYIPAENVYYEVIIRDRDGADGAAGGIFERSIARRVIPVSPNSLYAYLQVILLGLRGLTVEESARQIVAGLDRVSGDLGRFRETFDLVGRHLGNAVKQQENASRDLERLQGGFDTLRAIPAEDASDENPGAGGGRAENTPAPAGGS